MAGAYLARASAWETLAHRNPSAARARPVIWRSSAAKDLTTRTPLTFSSTMVATSAWRAAMTHESGKTRFRSRAPIT